MRQTRTGGGLRGAVRCGAAGADVRPRSALFPCASLTSGERLQFRLSARSFSYPPPAGSGYRPVLHAARPFLRLLRSAGAGGTGGAGGETEGSPEELAAAVALAAAAEDELDLEVWRRRVSGLAGACVAVWEGGSEVGWCLCNER